MITGRKRWSKIILIIFLIILVVATAFLLLQRKRAMLAGAPVYGLDPISVRTAEVKLGDMDLSLHYVAIVEPVRKSYISSRLTATIEQVHLREGDLVSAGQELAVLDSREIRDRIAAIEAQVEQGRSELAANRATVEALMETKAYWDREVARAEQLVADGALPSVEAEAKQERAAEVRGRLRSGQSQSTALEHRVAGLNHQLAELETRLSYTSLVSPYSGLVSERHVEPGDLAVPGQPLLTVEDHSQFKLIFDIPQGDLTLVSSGMPVFFKVNEEHSTAFLDRLHPSLGPARMLRAETELSENLTEYLVAGSWVPVRAVYRQLEDVSLIPTSSLIESPAEQPHVFIVERDRLVARPVRILGTTAGQAAVTGVEIGERVVLSTFLGWSTLSAGLEVEVRP